MSEKSIALMTDKEKKYHSLSTRVFRLVLLGASIMGILLLLLGMFLYSLAVANQYISTSYTLAHSAAEVLQKSEDVQALANEVTGRFRSMTDAERSDVDSEAYESRFADVQERKDFISIRTTLGYFLESSDVYDVYLAFYDRETGGLLYFADPSEEDVALPGYWEEVNASEIERFLSWDGEGMLYNISKMEKYGWICTSGYPLKNEKGEIYAFVLADITLKELVPKLTGFALGYGALLIVLIPLFGWLMLRHIKKKIVNPVNTIAEAAQTYVQSKSSGGQRGALFEGLNIHTGDEVENLALSMTEMEKDITNYEENLTRVTAEKQRIGTELALATRIQADMLPNIFPAFPERKEFNIYASMTPAKEVGGDFYDFFFVTQDRLAMVIADVSGKGIPAAMFMMMAKSMIQTQAASGRGPKEVLETVNRLICANNQEEMFVTVWFAILDMKSGRLTAANAGHEYPILKKPDGDFEIYKDKHGFVIGGMEHMRYKEYEIQLEPGSKLFVYTDGVAEATSMDLELFGMERTLEALNEAKDGSAEEILLSVNRAIDRFVGDAEQFDDLTMMCLEYNGYENVTEDHELAEEK